MSKAKWTRQTDSYWVAEIDGCNVAVKRMTLQSNGMKFYTAFFNPDGINWTSEGMCHLSDAKAAAEQVAQRWAKGEG